MTCKTEDSAHDAGVPSMKPDLPARLPFISVVTVVFNNEDGLNRTARSIRCQEYPCFEWIVVDGGSTDRTMSAVEQHRDLLAYCVSEPDKGIYDAMNKGLRAAKGDFVVFLNSGDVFSDARSLSKVGRGIQLSGRTVSMVCAGVQYRLPADTMYIQHPRDIDKTIWHGLPTSHQAIFFNIRDVEKIYYDIQYKVSADYYLVARYFKLNMPVLSVDSPVVHVELGGDSFSSRRWYRLINDCYFVQRRVLGLGRGKATLSYLRRITSRVAVEFLETRYLRNFVLYLMRFMKSKRAIS